MDTICTPMLEKNLQAGSAAQHPEDEDRRRSISSCTLRASCGADPTVQDGQRHQAALRSTIWGAQCEPVPDLRVVAGLAWLVVMKILLTRPSAPSAGAYCHWWAGSLLAGNQRKDGRAGGHYCRLVPSPYPLRTERLVLRVMRATDAVAFAAYRNDPEVARYQSWDLPFTEQDALSLLCGQADRDDVSPGQWTQFAVERDGELVGDVCAHLHDTCAVAEIGFTLARTHQGRGYASEAVQALVGDLVQRVGVGRVCAELDPENIASQRVLENVGLMYEATTKKSFLWRGQWARQHDLWRHRRGVHSLG